MALILLFAVASYRCERSEDAVTLVAFSHDGAVRAAAERGGNPAPPEGTRVLSRGMLTASRAVLRDFAASDPVVVNVGSFGRGDDGSVTVHLTVKNQGSCTARAMAGVVYAFDAWGKPSPVGAEGRHLFAFARDKLDLAPQASTVVSIPVGDVDVASIALGHIDEVTCVDGASWTRPKGR